MNATIANPNAMAAFSARIGSPSRIHVDLFSGIGGFALAAKANGVKTEIFCEQNEKCSNFLAANWGLPIINDVRIFDGKRWNGIWLLRHAYATHCLDRGTNLKALQQAMGHAQIETTAGYCHADALSVQSPLDHAGLEQEVAEGAEEREVTAVPPLPRFPPVKFLSSPAPRAGAHF